MSGRNNPRVFAETITLDTWRTAYDGERGEADLHIDVVFSEGGRIGGNDAPVRFRLSLRRAEVRVMNDAEEVIQIKPDSVMRAELPEPAKSQTTLEKKGMASVEAGIELSSSAAKAKLKALTNGKVTTTEKVEQRGIVPVMQLTHWKTDEGYGFKIASAKKRPEWATLGRQ
jgi:hypothetical protein